MIPRFSSTGQISGSASGKGFARRSYPARVVGLGLGFIAVAAALFPLSRSPLLWGTLVVYSFIWPHAAYFYAIRISDSLRTGQRQLVVDSLCGGFWAAAMSFNLLPSILIITMLGMNNMASGGLRLYGKGVAAQLVGAVGGVALFGWQPQWNSGLVQILACVPFLAVHPLAVGAMTHAFAQRLHAQKLQLEHLSRTDGLTGVYNRRYWQERASEEFDRSRRSGRPAVLLMMDIDHFKKINDRYGHSAGEQVLQDFANSLQRQLRRTDIVGRFGGEEFVAVLVDTDGVHAQSLVERLRSAVLEKKSAGEPHLSYTLSMGVSPISSQMSDFTQWLNAADTALYQAKASGRDRFCFYGGDCLN